LQKYHLLPPLPSPYSQPWEGLGRRGAAQGGRAETLAARLAGVAAAEGGGGEGAPLEGNEGGERVPPSGKVRGREREALHEWKNREKKKP
jgi:hypothetical protein